MIASRKFASSSSLASPCVTQPGQRWHLSPVAALFRFVNDRLEVHGRSISHPRSHLNFIGPLLVERALALPRLAPRAPPQPAPHRAPAFLPRPRLGAHTRPRLEAVSEPWFRAQALAWVARFTDSDPVAIAKGQEKTRNEVSNGVTVVISP